MEPLVKQFLESEEGQTWMQNPDVHSMLGEIRFYITELSPLPKETITYMMQFFPEFCYEGVGYRFISQPLEKTTPLIWDDTQANYSWSLHTQAYVSVLKSLGYQNHEVHIYQARIRGLNLKSLIEHLKVYNDRLKLAYSLLEKEDEILVTEYSELTFIEKIHN